jgi:8-oxo-dGTP pyrophosphatase MutT (NUDIX family)
MKYARIERERRFLVALPPSDLGADYRRIEDLYVPGTQLRLRRVTDAYGQVVALKLARKHRAPELPPTHTVITNLYLEPAEYERLRALGGRSLVKRRHRHPPGGRFAVDVFEGPLQGLVLAEAEAASDEELAALEPPRFAHCEVTADAFFTGGSLASAPPERVAERLRELLPTVRRRAARLLAIDAGGRVLLFEHARVGGERFWATPGGGLEPGESFEQAAAREAEEELGVTPVRLESLWTRRAVYPFGTFGARIVDQEERFFLLRLAPTELSESVRAEHEKEGILGWRWWSAEELEASGDPVFPERLAGDLRELLGRLSQPPAAAATPRG